MGSKSTASLEGPPAETLKLLNSHELRRMGGVGKARAGRVPLASGFEHSGLCHREL